MSPTPPRKTTSGKNAAAEPLAAAGKTPTRGEALVSRKKVAAVEPAAEAPKVARKSAVAKPKTPAKKAASGPTGARKPSVAAGTGAVAAPAAEPRRKSPVRIHAAPATLSPPERHRLVEVAAYYIAERRGFGGGSHHDDWVQAEREVDAMIAAGKFNA
jgi:hypothetical protein